MMLMKQSGTSGDGNDEQLSLNRFKGVNDGNSGMYRLWYSGVGDHCFITRKEMYIIPFITQAGSAIYCIEDYSVPPVSV